MLSVVLKSRRRSPRRPLRAGSWAQEAAVIPGAVRWAGMRSQLLSGGGFSGGSCREYNWDGEGEESSPRRRKLRNPVKRSLEMGIFFCWSRLGKVCVKQKKGGSLNLEEL